MWGFQSRDARGEGGEERRGRRRETALVGLQRGVGLRWLSVVNKQRQVPESLDGADLGSGAPGM